MPRWRPFWRRQERLADWLPWLLPLDDAREAILTAAGGLLRVVKIEPPDFETASPEELVAHHVRIGAGPARFGNGWSFWFDQWRTAASGYLEPCSFGGCLAAQLVDQSRQRHFTDTARPVFRNSAFLAVHYLPQRRDALAAWLMDRANSQVAANVAFFLENSDSLFQELAHALRAVTVLRGDELSSYLSACVTFEPKRTQFPTGVMADQLASREWRAFDRTERPERAQLMLAYTRADVRVLNELARERMRGSGHLGEDREVRTERGPRRMAVGDRVLFLRNERGLGVKNGTLGELRSLQGSVLEVQLDDAGKRGAGALIQFDLRDYASLDHGYATTIHKSQGTTVGRSYVLASEHMDRHATYVAMTRHTGRADLHYGRDEFPDEERLAARLSRERAKDTTLDYAREEPPMVRSGDQPQNGPQGRQAAAQDRDGPIGSAGRDLASERQQPSVTAENSRSEARTGADRREGELVESAGRDGRRDTALDGDRTNDSPLDQRTRAALQRAKERLRAERGTGHQDRQRGRVAQALVQVRDLFKDRAERSRDGQGRGR